MKSGTKKRLIAGLTAGTMLLAMASPAMAQPTQITGGNLIAALNNVNVEITDVDVITDSVNNNTVTVNVNALQNFLNRNDVDVNIEDVLNDANVEILNNLVTIQDIQILDDGTLLILI